jgi:AcrR family transcriptional regulator
MPRIVDHEERRDEILARCFELFARHGYATLTMRAIATALGVSTGTLYHYFTGKTELFQAMLAWIARRDIHQATEALRPEATLPERIDHLARFVEAHGETLQSALRIALDFHRQQPEAEPRRALQLTVQEYERALAEQFGPSDPRLASMMMSLILGGLVHRMLDPDGPSPAVELRGLLTLSGMR